MREKRKVPERREDRNEKSVTEKRDRDAWKGGKRWMLMVLTAKG